MKRGSAGDLFRIIRRIRIVAALAFTLTLSGTTAAQSAQSYRQRAAEFARSKSWDEAIAAYRKALELSPNDPATHYELAFALRYKGDTRQAVEEFESALRLKPSWADAHYGLGATWYELRNLPAALKELSKAVQLDPSNAGAHRLLARVYADQNNFSAAETELSRAIVLKPTAEMHFELGEIEGQLGKLDAAATEFRKALVLDPQLARAHVMLGITLRRQGDHKGALSQFRKAVEITPKDPNAQYNLGMELKTDGDTPGAIAAFRRAIELKPDFEMAHYNLGIALRSQGETAAAHKELDELTALKEYRSHLAEAKLLILKGVDALKKQQLDNALSLFQKAIEQSPQLPTGYYYLGVTWDRKQDVARAREAYQKALELKPDYAQAHSSLGLLYWRLNDNAHALEEFHQAVMSDPDLPEAHYNFGLALAQSGQLDEAARELNEALSLEPGYNDARIQLGLVLSQKGDLAGATSVFRALVRREPNFAEAHNNLGLVLLQAGDTSAAKSGISGSGTPQTPLCGSAFQSGIGTSSTRKGGGFAGGVRKGLRNCPGVAKRASSLDVYETNYSSSISDANRLGGRQDVYCRHVHGGSRDSASRASQFRREGLRIRATRGVFYCSACCASTGAEHRSSFPNLGACGVHLDHKGLHASIRLSSPQNRSPWLLDRFRFVPALYLSLQRTESLVTRGQQQRPLETLGPRCCGVLSR